MSSQTGSRKHDELEEKVLFVNRCSKVVKGGRKFSFSALILVGDRQGRVGYGFGKANELTDAIRKGGEAARRNLITFEMEATSIPHEVLVDCDGAVLLLKPAPEGTGVIAGSRVRSVLEFAGVRDVVAKSMGSCNPLNQVKAAFKALSSLRNRQRILEMRGIA
ncbi:MAG: 30S ribosomal protein S5 [Verrucomicrobia bacterium]|nr:30S ribosomal protein S5 [Verrucomicrobiota bacterium]MBS0647163.1 30S ribosomal protein S5 [Verrucomicrobiota bacterium]